MENISETLARLNERRAAQAKQARKLATKPADASIEETVANATSSSIEALPDEIEVLIDNKNYRNKFKKRIREGHLHDLLDLAEIAHTKGRPSRWFAKVTAKANWEKTLEFLAKFREVSRIAEEAMEKLAAPADQVKVVYKACWKAQGNAIRHMVTAVETGQEKLKYFSWLCFKSEARTGHGATS